MIHVEGSYYARENEKLNCVVLIIMTQIHLYAVNHHLILLFVTLSLASAWPQSFGLGLGLSLRTLASASVSASRFWPRLTSLVKIILANRRR